MFDCWLKCGFTSKETVGLLGTGAQDVHLDFHTAPELCTMFTYLHSLIRMETFRRPLTVSVDRRAEIRSTLSL